MNSIKTICILRLSAIGDATHVLPVIHRIQQHQPDWQITWVIGKLEYKLVRDIPGVNYIVFDKSAGIQAYKDLRRQLSHSTFDVLLHMQVALRANLASLFIKAKQRIGYDRARSKDLHGLFINQRIKPSPEQHVLDCLGSFIEPLGIPPAAPVWPIVLTDDDQAFADRHVDSGRPSLAISPCSSHKLRNWLPERYAAVADYAAKTHGFQIILCGGPSAFEREFGDHILSHTSEPVVDLIGQDTLKQSAALFQKVDAVIAPDTGPAHIANAMGTPVIGLYAASNPRRSGPYSSQEWTIDAYSDAANRFLNRSPDQLRWGAKVEVPGAMDLIEVDQVCEQIDRLAKKLS